jgi:hypothetical protein
MDTEIIKRPTVEDLFRLKLRSLARIQLINDTERELDKELEEIGGHTPGSIDWRFDYHGHKSGAEKCIDRMCWRYLVQSFHLQKYMLCTEYDKMVKEIEDFQTPDFTPENAAAWIDGLKDLVHENVKSMIRSVYDKIINDHYWTGGRYRGQKKKRNNSGVDRHFIILTNDYSNTFGWGYYRNHPTITDDLEKVCYILDGLTIPDKTIKARMASDKTEEGENEYFHVKFCKNGNTHYTMKPGTLEKLNRIGPDGNLIGDKIWIKIF